MIATGMVLIRKYLSGIKPSRPRAQYRASRRRMAARIPRHARIRRDRGGRGTGGQHRRARARGRGRARARRRARRMAALQGLWRRRPPARRAHAALPHRQRRGGLGRADRGRGARGEAVRETFPPRPLRAHGHARSLRRAPAGTRAACGRGGAHGHRRAGSQPQRAHAHPRRRFRGGGGGAHLCRRRTLTRGADGGAGAGPRRVCRLGGRSAGPPAP